MTALLPSSPATGPAVVTGETSSAETFNGAALPVEHLVDPVCGVVRRITDFPRLPGLPDRFISCVASVADTRQFAIWLSDRIAAGTSFTDHREAWMGALGEAVERYCGNNIPATLQRSSQTALRSDGTPHLGAEELAGFLPEQLALPGFPYRAMTPDLDLLWARGVDQNGAPCLVPGSWVYLNWHQGPRRGEPRTNHLNYAGIATGQGLPDAADRALAECLERDAVVSWWLLGLRATAVDPFSIGGFEADWAGCPFQLRLVSLPSTFGMPVFGALVFDTDNGIPAAGFSAGEDPTRAGRKAIAEALQVWIASSGLTHPEGASYRAVAGGLFSARAYLPHRPGRNYLDDAGLRFENIRDLAAQTQLWLDTRLHPLLSRFDGDGTAPVDIHQLTPGSLPLSRQTLTNAGHRTVTVDLTTADIAETGLAVARVLVGGLLPNAPAAYPYLSTPRLTRLAADHALPVPTLGTVTLAPPPHN